MRDVPQGPLCETLARFKKRNIAKENGMFWSRRESENELASTLHQRQRKRTTYKQGCDNLLTMLNFLCYFIAIFCVWYFYFVVECVYLNFSWTTGSYSFFFFITSVLYLTVHPTIGFIIRQVYIHIALSGFEVEKKERNQKSPTPLATRKLVCIY